VTRHGPSIWFKIKAPQYLLTLLARAKSFLEGEAVVLTRILVTRPTEIFYAPSLQRISSRAVSSVCIANSGVVQEFVIKNRCETLHPTNRLEGVGRKSDRPSIEVRVAIFTGERYWSNTNP